MQGIVKTRTILTLLALTSVTLGSLAVIYFARGYRPDLKNGSLKSTGILALNSYPDSAKVYINGTYSTITKNTVNLEPNSYDIEIKQEGFIPWKKKLSIKAETVTSATAWLFPTVPSLKAITSTGAANPSVSPDKSKVAYLNNNTLYTIDLTESPLGLISRVPKELASLKDLKIKLSDILWSPDNSQIILSSSSSAYLVDTTNSPKILTPEKLLSLKSEWDVLNTQKFDRQMASLPKQLSEFFATTSAQINWSPDETKLLYTATASAIIPEGLIPPLPGSSTQSQTHQLEPGSVYVYDIEEDRNFKIDSIILSTPTPKNIKTSKRLDSRFSILDSPINSGWQWFSSSNHIYKAKSENSFGEITIKEYDNQNQAVVYSGPMQTSFAASYPSSKQMLILSNLNPASSPLSNLYAISLR